MASLTRGSLFRTLALGELIVRIVVIRDMYRRVTLGNMWSIQIAAGMGSLLRAKATPFGQHWHRGPSHEAVQANALPLSRLPKRPGFLLRNDATFEAMSRADAIVGFTALITSITEVDVSLSIYESTRSSPSNHPSPMYLFRASRPPHERSGLS